MTRARGDWWRAAALAAALGGLACAPAEPPAEPEQPFTVANVGLQTPESVLYDSVADVYLVSNINGAPLEVDGNGFISRLAPSGEVLALRWIDGAADGITLNAPKGMAIVGDVLYVSDITTVRLFDRNTGGPLGEIPVPGSSFLNDLVAGPDGSVYLTDSGLRANATGFEPAGTDAVYRISATGEVTPLATGAELGAPNGVLVMDGQVWVVTFGSGELYRVADGARMDVETPPGGSLDGLIAVDGELLFSSWGAQSVFRRSGPGAYASVVDSAESPADIGFDPVRRRILIPLFTPSEVRIVPLP